MKEKIEIGIKFLKKKLRISVVFLTLLFGVLILAISYSYALFTIRHEQKNAVSLVAGTLVYTIESDRLQDRQIVVSANSTEDF